MKLKDFQKATVKHVIEKLNENNRFLVADEVGLGKTIVARGVIEELYEQHKSKKKAFHVIYICSNQVLAQQNIRKLNINGSDLHDAYSRLFLMVKKKESNGQSDFIISTLTPNTSFRMKKSKGTAEERAILYKILRGNVYKSDDKKVFEPIKKLLQGDCEDSWSNWWTNGYIKKTELKNGVEQKIIEEFKQRDLLTDIKQYFNGDSSERAVDLIMKMRSAVTSVVIDHYLDADLFILDEFQRFNDLIKFNEDDEEQSEIKETAEKIFKGGKKILLLSATPFKQYTTQWEIENDEDHFTAFNEVLSFLVNNSDDNYLDKISEKRKQYFSSIQGIKWDNPDSIHDGMLKESRNSLASLYMEGISRTERAIVEEIPLVSDKSIKKLYPKSEGLKIIVSSLKFLNENITHKRYNHQLVEFSKSTPFPFSFLSGYKLYDEISQSTLIKNKQYLNNCVSYHNWNNYKLNPAEYSSKIGSLIQSHTENHGELLLWIPPSMSYYDSPEPFKQTKGFSKTLIFSQWTMVPRAISSLISYEMEKRISIESDEKPSYFIKTNERRKPTPILVFRSDENSDVSSNSILLYPSSFIAENLDFSKGENQTIEEVIAKQNEKIKKALKFKGTSQATSDKYWNWLSMFLLDIKNGHSQEVDTWLNFYQNIGNDADTADDENKRENKGLKNFVKIIRDRIDSIDKESLYNMPENIHEVLSYISIASPAICSYRSLLKTYPKIGKKDLLWYASTMAAGFRTLFNKPESIQIIQKVIPGNDPYWFKCLQYSAMNNIQSMIDEYIYLLWENLSDLKKVVEIFESTITTRNSSLEMDFAYEGKEIRHENVRCHYAAPYGTQRVNTETGEKRMIGIREVFNSPFRPFVLTTTSIGQEGLDFHWYCRNIYHWNLPHNPIDLEQREGRINRYKSHVIRLNRAKGFMPDYSTDNSLNIWSKVFEDHESMEEANNKSYCDLVPYWHLNCENEESYKIERTVPIYAFSRDEEKYHIILKVLSLYRMTFGQPNQEQIMNSFLKDTEGIDYKDIKKIARNICINLAPVLRSKNA
ncbi:MAG: DEAD/DEAH box helicase [Bacteroidota bacterium]